MEVACSNFVYTNMKDRCIELIILEQCHNYFDQEMCSDHYNKILLIHKGKGSISDLLTRKEFSAPCAFIYAGNQPFSFDEVSRDFDSEAILFENSFYNLAEIAQFQGYADFIVKDTRSITNYLKAGNNYKSVSLIFDEIRSELEFEFADRDILANYIDILFLKILKAIKQESASEFNEMNTKQRNHFINAMMDLVEKYFRTERRTHFYAKEMCIAPNTLTKYMKRYFGIPLTQLINERVIMEAKRELSTTDKSIKEVAYDLGFDDPLYFSRLFKKITKVCPKDFKA